MTSVSKYFQALVSPRDGEGRVGKRSIDFAPLPPAAGRRGLRDVLARCSLADPNLAQLGGYDGWYAWRKRQLAARAVAALTK
jgi:hypothetical protein